MGGPLEWDWHVYDHDLEDFKALFDSCGPRRSHFFLCGRNVGLKLSVLYSSNDLQPRVFISVLEAIEGIRLVGKNEVS